MTSDDLCQGLAIALQALIGEKLSSVTFVQDYWQIAFDGSGFTVYSSVTVRGEGFYVRDGETGFRDRLCERIATRVMEADTQPGFVVLTFSDSCKIELSTRQEDLQGPEALTFKSFGSELLWAI